MIPRNPWTPLAVAAALTCFSGTAAAQGIALDDLADEDLSLAGSNSLGATLAPALVEDFLLSRGNRGLEWRPLGAPEEAALVVQTPSELGPSYVELRARGSQTAFEALAEGIANIGLASRRITDAEVARFADMGDWSTDRAEHVIALDGLAILVHPANRVSSLTVEQIQAIFTGAVTNWSEVGGADLPINVYSREEGSGTFDTFDALVLKGAELTSGATVVSSETDLSEAVAANLGGVTFSGLAYERNARAISVDECGFGYLPTEFAVKSEDYPLARRLYVYTPQQTRTPMVESFMTYAKSVRGQDIVQDAGFVNLSVEVVSPGSAYLLEKEKSGLRYLQRVDVLKDYIESTQDAQQLSTVLRFEQGASRLDNKSVNDLLIVGEYLSRPENRDREIYIFGFSDTLGDYGANLNLARSRAQIIADALSIYNITATRVDGFGEEVPVACNTTPEGRERNRRVEIWIK